ncbi:hypothetical protein [Enterobacter mori]|uniref:hypothetical protein n=1 Tax=Enterobacter mori TaxID=539813 RepID=UPI003B840B8F
MAAGIGALDRQVQLYLKRGRNTIDSIFDIYSEKNKEGYKEYMTNLMEIGRDDVISPNNNSQILKMIKGIITMENGGQYAKTISDNDILRAMAMNRNGQLPGATPQQTVRVDITQQPGSDINAQIQGIYLPR